jgi:hypothetical protein
MAMYRGRSPVVILFATFNLLRSICSTMSASGLLTQTLPSPSRTPAAPSVTGDARTNPEITVQLGDSTPHTTASIGDDPHTVFAGGAGQLTIQVARNCE